MTWSRIRWAGCMRVPASGSKTNSLTHSPLLMGRSPSNMYPSACTSHRKALMLPFVHQKTGPTVTQTSSERRNWLCDHLSVPVRPDPAHSSPWLRISFQGSEPLQWRSPEAEFEWRLWTRQRFCSPSTGDSPSNHTPTKLSSKGFSDQRTNSRHGRSDQFHERKSCAQREQVRGPTAKNPLTAIGWPPTAFLHPSANLFLRFRRTRVIV